MKQDATTVRLWEYAMGVIGRPGTPVPTGFVIKYSIPKDVCDHADKFFGFPAGTMSSKTGQKRELINAKHMVRAYLRKYFPNEGLVAIGRIAGKTDHTNVLNSLTRHDDYMKFDRSYREQYNAFEKECLDMGFLSGENRKEE